MTLSPQEEYLIGLLRELKPYEEIIVTKDKDGHPDRFLVKLSQKIMCSEIGINAVK